MSVGRVASAHFLYGGRKQATAGEDVRVLGEEAENQAGHKMIHVGAAFRGIPLRVVPPQFDIESVQAAGRPDIEGAFPDLLDCRDSGQREEVSEVIREVAVRADDRRRVASQVLGLEGFPVRGENKFGLGSDRSWTGLEGGEQLCNLTGSGDSDVNIAGLQHSAQVGFVGFPFTQPLEGRFLVAESLQEGEREFRSIECLLG